MGGLLSGLAGLGLDNLEDAELFGENKEEDETDKQKAVSKPDERNFIFDKKIQCPVCDQSFTNKTMKSSRARLLGTDQDLRPHHEGIDSVKYDVELCPHCGYAALSRFFPHVTDNQIRLIRENISRKVHLHAYNGETYTYEEAEERYKLALANAIVKKARVGEKAYICLKSAWLLRGHADSLEQEQLEGGADTQELQARLRQQEQEYLVNAYEGFSEAGKTERFPICGMDETTLDYLQAVLALRLKRYEDSAKLMSKILISTAANARMKDKARELKSQLFAELKEKKGK